MTKPNSPKPQLYVVFPPKLPLAADIATDSAAEAPAFPSSRPFGARAMSAETAPFIREKGPELTRSPRPANKCDKLPCARNCRQEQLRHPKQWAKHGNIACTGGSSSNTKGKKSTRVRLRRISAAYHLLWSALSKLFLREDVFLAL